MPHPIDSLESKEIWESKSGNCKNTSNAGKFEKQSTTSIKVPTDSTDRERFDKSSNRARIFLETKVKSTVAKGGDKNTRLFHAKATQHRKNNTIRGLEDKCGHLQAQQAEINQIANRYFSKLFTSSNPLLTR